MRSVFFALGMFVLLWGGVFLLVDQMVISPHSSLMSAEVLTGWWTTWDEGRQAALHPPEWAAFSLLVGGSLTMLYSVGLPGKMNHPQ